MCTLWTSYKNLKTWFGTWKENFLDLGFAKQVAVGTSLDVIIPEDQLKNIINLDETCLSLDGSKSFRGGPPEVIFYDPRFPQLGVGTSKSASTMTMIGGGNAASKALPTHLQFQTSAQRPENEKMT